MTDSLFQLPHTRRITLPDLIKPAAALGRE